MYGSRQLGEYTTASQIAYALKLTTLLGVTSGLAKALFTVEQTTGLDVAKIYSNRQDH